MNIKLKRTLKIISISIGVILVAVLTIIAIAINFVFTPEKLTPVVLAVANDNLNAKLDMKRVELTFFSTFPKFGLELEDGSLVSKTINDTLWTATDSLASFRQCIIEISPLDYLMSQKVNIHQLLLTDAKVYAFRNAEGKANWNIVKESNTPTDNTDGESPTINEIALDRISLLRSNIIFDDRDTRIYTQVDSANLDLKAQLHQKDLQLAVKFNNKNLLFWQNGELLANHLQTEINTDLDFVHQTRTLNVKNARVSVNNIALDVEGSIRHDSINKAAFTDVHYRLHAPSFKTVLSMIPESVVKKEGIDANGEVKLDGHLKGAYGKGKMPQMTLDILVNNASAHYKGMPYGINDIDLNFNAFIDLMRTTPSYANLKIFRVEGAHTKIVADAKVNHLLSDPDISIHINSDVDLTVLANTFPLQEGVRLGGKLKADLKAQCRLSSLQRQDFGRVKVDGKLDMKNMELSHAAKNFLFRSDATFQFSGQEKQEAALAINEILLQSRLANASIKQMKATVNSANLQDTTKIAELACSFEANELRGRSGDSLAIFTQHVKVKANLHPSPNDKQKPEISFSLDTDSLFAKMNAYQLGMDKGGFGIRLDKRNDSIWSPSGIIGFQKLQVRTPELKLPIHMEKTAVTIKDQMVKLKQANLRIGKSNLTASGALLNVFDSWKHKAPIKAKLHISSQYLDGNQLINALNAEAEPVGETTSDTLSSEAPLELFVIPDNIDFELHTQLDKVTYAKMSFEKVRGAVDVRQQAIHLKNLTMRGLDADMKATLVYQAKNKDKGYTGFDFKLEKVNIGKLVDFIPALDSIVPMLRSFKGIVNFDAAAEAQLDHALNIKIPTLRSAVHIKGDSLVLMDGETFAEISKMMMFKNKKRNLIDSIYVNMTIDKGNVTVYPFIVQMDRYRAAVGGTQDLDMNFKYHISVLKSPVPFKLGVNITGNLDKMKFRVGKAKYKDQVTPVAIRKVDSTCINLGKDIIRDFEKVFK